MNTFLGLKEGQEFLFDKQKRILRYKSMRWVLVDEYGMICNYVRESWKIAGDYLINGVSRYKIIKEKEMAINGIKVVTTLGSRYVRTLEKRGLYWCLVTKSGVAIASTSTAPVIKDGKLLFGKKKYFILSNDVKEEEKTNKTETLLGLKEGAKLIFDCGGAERFLCKKNEGWVLVDSRGVTNQRLYPKIPYLSNDKTVLHYDNVSYKIVDEVKVEEELFLGKYKCGDNFYYNKRGGSLRILTKNQNNWCVTDEKDQLCNTFVPESTSLTSDGFTEGKMFNYVYKENEKMTEKKFYKVVCKDNMKSSNNTTNPVQYELNKFVYPTKPGTFLFVFNSLDNAKRYANRGQLVYECEVEGLCTTTPQFMEGKTNNLPTGTCFAAGVKITKLVHGNKIDGVPGRMWYLVNNNGATEVWKENDDSTVTRTDVPSTTKIPLDSDKGFCNRTVGKFTDYWYLTNDKEECETLTKLLKNKVVQFC